MTATLKELEKFFGKEHMHRVHRLARIKSGDRLLYEGNSVISQGFDIAYRKAGLHRIARLNRAADAILGKGRIAKYDLQQIGRAHV